MLLLIARAEEDLSHHQKLTNQLFDDSLNASATFVAVVSLQHLIKTVAIVCVSKRVFVYRLTFLTVSHFTSVVCLIMYHFALITFM